MAKTFNRRAAEVLCIFVECPTTGRTLEGMPHDDKVICNCPTAMERGGTHIVSQCKASNVDRYMKERGYTEAT